MTIIRNTGLLALGWNSHPHIWTDVHEEGKDSIREVIAVLSTVTTRKKTAELDALLMEQLPHLFDQRFNLPTARFGATSFWENLYGFNSVCYSLIAQGFVTNPNKMQDIIACVSSALDRYNRWMVDHAHR